MNKKIVIGLIILTVSMALMVIILFVVKENPENIVCTTEWNPVCGKNGVTYSNGCVLKVANQQLAYKNECSMGCQTDSDCACGVNKDTRQCASGNRNYIDTTVQCPDYCSGLDGKTSTVCQNNYCTMVRQ